MPVYLYGMGKKKGKINLDLCSPIYFWTMFYMDPFTMVTIYIVGRGEDEEVFLVLPVIGQKIKINIIYI